MTSERVLDLLEGLVTGEISQEDTEDYLTDFVDISDYYEIDKSSLEDEGYGYTCLICNDAMDNAGSDLSEDKAEELALDHMLEYHVWDIIKKELDKAYRNKKEVS